MTHDKSKDFEEITSIVSCYDSNCFAEKEKLIQQQKKNHACCEEQKTFSNTFSEKCFKWNCFNWVLICLTASLF